MLGDRLADPLPNEPMSRMLRTLADRCEDIEKDKATVTYLKVYYDRQHRPRIDYLIRNDEPV